MRLITHNMLKSNVKGVSRGFPLLIEPEQIENRPVEYNPGLRRSFLTSFMVVICIVGAVGT